MKPLKIESLLGMGKPLMTGLLSGMVNPGSVVSGYLADENEDEIRYVNCVDVL